MPWTHHTHPEKSDAPPFAALRLGPRAVAGLVPEIFHDLSKDAVANIFAAAVLRRFDSGQTISHAHQPAQHMFLLKNGAVNYFRVTPEGQEILLRRLSRNEAFGLGTLLSRPVEYIGTAEAIRDSELFVWGHHSIWEFSERYPAIARNALRIALEYLRLYSDRHLAFVSGHAEDRVARSLALLGKRIGQNRPGGVEVQITNENLASLADVSSFTVSRVLNKWEHKGALEKSRGRILIRCPECMLA
jgi:CRP/FNR family transcriptional regulator, nitrogen oxide reductase regulator